MIDKVDPSHEAEHEKAKLHLITENESVVRHAVQQHETLVASWVESWRTALFPVAASPQVPGKLSGKKRR